MSDMYTILRIEDPNPDWRNEDEQTVTDVLREFDDSWFEQWSEGVDEWPGGAISIAGWSKYQVEGATHFAEEYTKANPDSTVSIREEWTGEGGPDITTKVYSNGEILEDESTYYDELPSNLPQLIANVRALYTDTKHNHGAFGCEACMLTEAARGLVGALDPTGGQQ